MSDDSFGAFFRQTGLSLDEAALIVGSSPRNLRRYVAGELRAPKLALEKVQELAAALPDGPDQPLEGLPLGRRRQLQAVARPDAVGLSCGRIRGGGGVPPGARGDDG